MRQPRDPWRRMSATMAEAVGREVLLARTNLALSNRAAARLGGVAPQTQARVEAGDPSVSVETWCRVASGMGLKLWARAFPAATPSLRDTGQLRIAEFLRSAAAATFSVAVELPLRNLVSADMVLFGPMEIIHVEIERLLADWQAQYRSAAAKRDQLAAMHERPVRLVIAVEDADRNRAAVSGHEGLIESMLPASTRTVMHAIRAGTPLGSDGLVWVRPRRMTSGG